MARLLYSAIQPTGAAHLGNYLGSLRAWARLSRERACVFGLVDLHALTASPHQAPLAGAARAADVRAMAAAVLAAGVDAERAPPYVQSQLPQHSQLQWLLACRTPLPWLEHMTQFRAKAAERQHAQLGLLAYPVLMAADILLFRAGEVPVGDDQRQHLELARRLAQSFNAAAGEEVFPLPQPLYSEVPRVMSLSDASKKMSKSAASARSRIELADSPDAVAAKVARARTDGIAGISFEPERRPELANLLRILAALLHTTPEAAAEARADMGMADFKRELAEALVEELRPVRHRLLQLEDDPAYLDQVLARGAERARAIAQPTLDRVHALLGL